VDIDKNHSNKEASRLARQFTRIDCHSEEDTERIQEGWANFLTFIGTPGSGKTRLALTIGLYLIRHDAESVRYWQVQDLFETLKGTFNKSQKRHNSYDGNDDEIDDSYNKILESIKGCETLILDDLGAENGTEWVRSILDMLVDYRYENKMNTIITSNVSDVSELSPRIASRLSEGNICKILMPDFRKIKAVQREKKSRKVTNG
jgi:DNA replication protein DnaC